MGWAGEMEEKGGPLKNSVLFVLRSLFVLPLDSFIFLAPLALSGYSSQPNERALFPSVARISLIRGTYVRASVRVRERRSLSGVLHKRNYSRGNVATRADARNGLWPRPNSKCQRTNELTTATGSLPRSFAR